MNDAQAELDRLDSRTPVPLLPMMANHQKQNMRDHLLAVQEIVSALQKCTGCHAAFRQKVVDDVTWKRLASNPDKEPTSATES